MNKKMGTKLAVCIFFLEVVILSISITISVVFLNYSQFNSSFMLFGENARTFIDKDYVLPSDFDFEQGVSFQCSTDFNNRANYYLAKKKYVKMKEKTNVYSVRLNNYYNMVINKTDKENDLKINYNYDYEKYLLNKQILNATIEYINSGNVYIFVIEGGDRKKVEVEKDIHRVLEKLQ